MLGTNRQFESLIRNIDSQVGQLRRALLHDSSSATLAAMLDELLKRRQMLKLLMLNRQIEASKSVVDFQKWRDGNGAIYLCAARFQEPVMRARV